MPLAHLITSPIIEVRELLHEAVRADNYEAYEQAIRELQALIDQHPCSSRLRVHLADLVSLQEVCAQGSAADGIPLIVKEASKADPFDPESLEPYAFALSRESDPDAAHWFQQAIAAEARVSSHFGLADVLIDGGDFDEAEVALEDSERLVDGMRDQIASALARIDRYRGE